MVLGLAWGLSSLGTSLVCSVTGYYSSLARSSPLFLAVLLKHGEGLRSIFLVMCTTASSELQHVASYPLQALSCTHHAKVLC